MKDTKYTSLLEVRAKLREMPGHESDTTPWTEDMFPDEFIEDKLGVKAKQNDPKVRELATDLMVEAVLAKQEVGKTVNSKGNYHDVDYGKVPKFVKAFHQTVIDKKFNLKEKLESI